MLKNWSVEELAAAFEGIEIVIHCAGNASYGNGSHYEHDNVGLTEHILAAIRQYAPQLKRFVFVSSIGAVDRQADDPLRESLTEKTQPNPTTDYGRSKLLAEHTVIKSALPYTIIRPTMVVGSDMRGNSHFAVFCRHALRRTLIGRLAWPGAFSVIHVDDLAEAMIAAALDQKAENRVYFCAGHEITIEKFFNLAAPGVRRIPLNSLSGFLSAIRRWLPFNFKAMFYPALTASDLELQSLGWRPAHSLESSLQAVIDRERARLDYSCDPGGQTVITGAASGLGRALAEALAPIRRNLLLIDRNKEGLMSIQMKYPHCRLLALDLSDEEAINEMTAYECWREEPISELFACAGLGIRGRVENASMRGQSSLLKVNLIAPLLMGIQAIRQMKRRHFGRIILISSSAAFQALPYMAAYAASKSALLSLGLAWAAESDKSDGVQIITVCPGGMNTAFQDRSGVRQNSGETLMSPEEAVARILKTINSQKNGLKIVSIRAAAMSLLARCLPRSVETRLWKFLMAKLR